MNEIADKIFQDLKIKYQKSLINKKELAQELGCTIGTIDQHMKMKSKNLPSYKKLGDGINGKVLFPLHEVAIFLAG